MTKILWERAWQDEREVESAISSLFFHQTSLEVMRYVITAGCPLTQITGDDLCQTHDLDLIRAGMQRGVSILEPEGWATTFRRIGSRPLIRFYLEERDRIPGLKEDAVRAMCFCIQDSRLRALALLRWAGVDPLGKAPRWHPDDSEDEWDGFPALHLHASAKPREILKLLKLKPSIPQWFDMLDRMPLAGGDYLQDILALVN